MKKVYVRSFLTRLRTRLEGCSRRTKLYLPSPHRARLSRLSGRAAIWLTTPALIQCRLAYRTKCKRRRICSQQRLTVIPTTTPQRTKTRFEMLVQLQLERLATVMSLPAPLLQASRAHQTNQNQVRSEATCSQTTSLSLGTS